MDQKVELIEDFVQKSAMKRGRWQLRRSSGRGSSDDEEGTAGASDAADGSPRPKLLKPGDDKENRRSVAVCVSAEVRFLASLAASPVCRIGVARSARRPFLSRDSSAELRQWSFAGHVLLAAACRCKGVSVARQWSRPHATGCPVPLPSCCVSSEPVSALNGWNYCCRNLCVRDRCLRSQRLQLTSAARRHVKVSCECQVVRHSDFVCLRPPSAFDLPALLSHVEIRPWLLFTVVHDLSCSICFWGGRHDGFEQRPYKPRLATSGTAISPSFSGHVPRTSSRSFAPTTRQRRQQRQI